MKIKILCIIALLAFLLIIGCSSPSDKSTPSTTAPTKTYTVITTVTPSQARTPVPSATTTNAITMVTTVIPTKTPTQAITAPPEKSTTTTSRGTGVCDCSGNLFNCDDFATQANAQACYDYCKSQGKGDIHGLDANKDGSACENNKK